MRTRSQALVLKSGDEVSSPVSGMNAVEALVRIRAARRWCDQASRRETDPYLALRAVRGLLDDAERWMSPKDAA